MEDKPTRRHATHPLSLHLVPPEHLFAASRDSFRKNAKAPKSEDATSAGLSLGGETLGAEGPHQAPLKTLVLVWATLNEVFAATPLRTFSLESELQLVVGIHQIGPT